MEKTQTIPFESTQEFLVMRNLYESAVKQLALKFEVLNSEFNIQYSRSPIHHIESRVKSAQSIMAKLTKKGMPFTIATAKENINDIAGVRVVCNYIDDVYRVAEILNGRRMWRFSKSRTISRSRTTTATVPCISTPVSRYIFLTERSMW